MKNYQIVQYRTTGKVTDNARPVSDIPESADPGDVNSNILQELERLMKGRLATLELRVDDTPTRNFIQMINERFERSYFVVIIEAPGK